MLIKRPYKFAWEVQYIHQLGQYDEVVPSQPEEGVSPLNLNSKGVCKPQALNQQREQSTMRDRPRPIPYIISRSGI